MIQQILQQKFTLQPVITNYDISISDLNSPFLPEDLYTYNVEVPLTGWLTFINATDFRLPLIVRMHENSPFKLRCKKS